MKNTPSSEKSPPTVGADQRTDIARDRKHMRVNAIWLMNAATLALTVAGVVKSSTFEAKGANYYWAGTVGDFKTGATWWDGTGPGVTGTYSAIGTTANTVTTDNLYFGSNGLTSGTFFTTISVGSSNRTAQSINFVSGAAAYTFNGNTTRKWDVGSNASAYTPSSPAVINSSTSAQTFNIMMAAVGGTTAAKAVEFKQNNATGSLNFNTTATTHILNPYAYDWAISKGSTAAQATAFAAKGQSIQTSTGTVAAGYFIKLSGSGTINIAGTIDENARINFGSGTSPFASVKSTGNVIITNTGTTNLSGWNTYTGATTIGDGTNSGGVVSVGSPYAFGGNRAGDASAPYYTTPGAALGYGGSGTTAYFAGTLATGFSATTIGYGAVTVNSGMTVDLNGQTMLGQNALNISGAGASGSGVLRNNSATEATYAGAVTLGANSTVSAGTGNIIISGGLNTSTYNATFNGTQATTITGALSGSGTITKSGAGTLTLSGNNTYTGSLAINSGKVSVGGATGTGLSTTNALSFGAASSGIFALSGRSGSVGSLSGDSTAVIENNHTTGATFTTTASSDTTFAGVIRNGTTPSSTLAFTKAGSGALTLTGTNTYTGATNVSAGILKLSSTGSLNSGSAVTVGSSGTLQGSGTANGTLSISGTVNPGDAGVGTLNSGAVTLNTGGILNVQFYNGGSTAGTGWDLLSSTGAINVSSASGASAFIINLNTIASSGSELLTAGSPFAFDNTTTKAYLLISGSSVANFSADKFLLNTTNFSGASGGTWSVTDGASGIYATFTVADLSSALTWNAGSWTASGGLGGAGTWADASGAYDSAKTAVFTGTGGAVTVTSATVNKGITFSANNYVLSSGTITVSGSTDADNTISVDSGITSEIASAISSAVKLTKAGDGTLTLSGNNSALTGGLTISSGVIKVGSANALGLSSNAVTVSAGGSLDLNGTTMTGTNPLSLLGILTNTSGTSATYAGKVSLGDTRSIGGALGGNLTLSGGVENAGYALTLNPSANTLTVNGVSGSGAVNLTNSSTGSVVLSGAINNASSITNSGAGSNGSTISGNLGVNVTNITQNSATSSLLLSGDNSAYVNGVTITSGTVKVGSVNALGANASAVTVATGGTLDVNGTTMTATNSLTLNGAGSILTNSAAGAATYAGQVTLGAAKSIGGALGGNLTLSGGVANAGNALTLNPSANTLTVNGVSGTGAVTVTNSSTGAVELTGTINNSGSITNNGTGSNATTISGNIVGNGTTNVTGVTQNSTTSALQLLGDNTAYTGAFTLTAGTIKLGNAKALVGSAVTAATGTAFDLNGQTVTNSGTLSIVGTGVSSSGAIYNSSSNAATYNGPISITNTTTINSSTATGDFTLGGTINSSTLYTLAIAGSASNARTITLSGNITGGLALTAGDNGTSTTNLNTVILSGTNTHTGSLRVYGGNLRAMGTSALSASANLFSGTGLSDNSKLQLTPGLSYNMSSLTVSGNLTIESTDLITPTSITFTAASGNSLSGSSDKRINAGTGVTVNVSGSLDIVSTTATQNRWMRLGGTGNFVFNGVLQNGGTGATTAAVIGGLSMESTGTATLNAANTYTNTTKISAGTLKLGVAGALGATSGVVMTGGALDLNGLTVSGTTPLSMGASTLTNSTTNASSYAGLITLTSDATINAASGNIAITSTSAVLSLSSSTLTLDGGASTSSTLNTVLNGTRTGVFSLVKQGAGTWTLTGAPATAIGVGAINVTNGVLKLGATNVIGSNSSSNNGTIVINGGSLDLAGYGWGSLKRPLLSIAGTGYGTQGALMNSSGTSVTILSRVQLAADALIKTTGGISLTGQGVDDRVLDLQANTLTFNTGTTAASTIGNQIIGTGKLIKSGDGTLVLNPTNGTSAVTALGNTIGGITYISTAYTPTYSNSNTYSGGTEIQAGTLKIGTGGATPVVSALGSGAVTVSSSATLDLNGQSIDNSIAIAGDGPSGTSGAITNSSSNSATYSGLVSISAGGATINASSGSINISNAGTITGAGNTLTLAGSGNGTLASILGTTTGGLTKTGAGTWTLTAANTYTGATAINGGTINLVSAASTHASSTVTVGSSGTLHGSGSVGGSLVVSGKINPGDAGIGTLSAGSVTLNGGGVLNVQFYDGSSTAGTGWDLLSGSGAITVNSALGNVFTINLNSISSSTSELLVLGGNAATFDNASTLSYKLIGGTSVTGFSTDAFSLVTTGFTNATAGGRWSLTSDSAGIYATFTFSQPNYWSGASGWVLSNGAGGSGSWNSEDLTYSSDNKAVFGGATAGEVTVGSVDIARGLQFSTTGYNLTGGTITVTGASDTENTITTDANVTATVGSQISATNKLTKSGNGTLVLTANNSGMTGGLSVAGGTLKAGSDSALGSGTLEVLSSGTFDLDGKTISKAVTIAGSGVSGTSGAITNSATNAVSYSGLITLSAAASINASAGNIDISNAGTIAGAGYALTLTGTSNGTLASVLGNTTGGLIKSGTGTWTISGANTYTGATQVQAGTLKLNNLSALGAASSAVSVSNGATLDLNGLAISSTNPLALTGTLTNSSAVSASYAGAIAIGTTDVGSGTTAAISANVGNLTITGNLSTALNVARTLTLTGSGNGTLAGAYGNSATTSNYPLLVKDGTGTWVLSADNTTTKLSGTTIKQGILKLGSATALGRASSSNIVAILAGGTLDLAGYSTSQNQAILSLAGDGSTGSNGALTNTGTTASLFSGHAFMTANAMIVADNAISIGGSSSTRVFDNAGYNLTLSGSSTSSSNSIISSINGSGKLIKTGTGTWTINPSNNTAAATVNGVLFNSLADSTNYYSGGTEIQAGTLKLSKGTALGSGAVSVTSGASLDLNSVTMLNANQLTLNGTGMSGVGALTNSSSSSSIYIGNVIIASDATIRAAAGTINLSGVISGSNALTVSSISSSKSVNFTGTNANTFSGGLVLAGNDLQFSQANQLGSGTITSTDASSRLYLNGTSASVEVTNALNTGTSATTVLAIAPNNLNTVTSNGIISGSGQLKISGGGTLVLSGTNSNTYSGGTEVGTGTISLANDAALGSGTVNFGTSSNSILAYTDNNTVTRGFTIGTGSTDATSAAAYTANFDIATGKTVSLSGVIANKSVGAGKLTKTGNGVLTLGGTNTYSGITTVSAGTLNLTGSIASSALTISNSATVTATNAITESNVAAASANVASLTVNSGSALNLLAGSLKGTSMTVSATDAVNANAVINYSFGNTIALSGVLTLTGALNINLTSSLTGAGVYDVLTYASTTGLGSITLSGTASNADWVVSGEKLATSYRITVRTAFNSGDPVTSGNLTVPTGSNVGNVSGTATVTTNAGTTPLTVAAINSDAGGKVTLNGSANTVTTVASSGELEINGNTTITTLTSGTVAVKADTVVSNLNGGALTIDSGKKLSVASGDSAGTLGGSGILEKTGSGTLKLSGDNSSFAGVAKVNQGTLEVTGANALGGALNVDLGVSNNSNAAVLKFSGTTPATISTDINALSSGAAGNTIQNAGGGLLTLGGTLTKDGTVLTLSGGSNGINVTGVIDGASPNSDLVISTGTTTLSSVNTYDGPTYVRDGGVLVNGITNALPTGTNLVLGSGTTSGTYNLNGFNQSVSNLNTSGSAGTSNIITNGAAANGTATLTVTGSTNASTFAGVIQDGGAAKKTALAVTGGELTLTANNTFTGGISVTGGTLLAGSASALGVNEISVSGGGTLAAGDGSRTSTGVNALTVSAGSLVLSDGARLRVYVGSMYNNSTSSGPSYALYYNQANGAGVNYTYFDVTGGLDLSGVTTVGGVTIELYNDGTAIDWVASKRYNFTFMTLGDEVINMGTSGLSISSMFTFDASQLNVTGLPGGTLGDWGINANMSYDNAGTLTMSIPEPSTYGLGLGAFALAFAAIRRRRQAQAKAKTVA